MARGAERKNTTFSCATSMFPGVPWNFSMCHGFYAQLACLPETSGDYVRWGS